MPTSIIPKFNPKSIILLILMLVLATALMSCRSSKHTTESTRIEHSTAHESIQTQSQRLDSLIRTIRLNADTLDIWIFSNISTSDYESTDEDHSIMLPEIVVTPKGNDTLCQLPNTKGFTSAGKTIGDLPPRIRTPTATGMQSGLHIRAVGLQTNSTLSNTSQTTDKCSQSSQEEHNTTSSESDQRTKKSIPPWLFIIPPILLIFAWCAYRNFSSIKKWIINLVLKW